MTKKLSVIITGTTGAAGSGVLQACLNHPNVAKVSVITRKSIGSTHEKIVEVIQNNFLEIKRVEDSLADHDACFWCLGVSQVKVRKEADYHRITYDFTIEAARVLEKLNPGMTFCFLSGMGTDETQKSRLMWGGVTPNRTARWASYNFHLYNFRPGFINPVKGHKGGSIIGRILYPFIKNSPKMCVEANEFGMAMINVSLFGSEKHTLENSDIRELAKKEI